MGFFDIVLDVLFLVILGSIFFTGYTYTTAEGFTFLSGTTFSMIAIATGVVAAFVYAN
jgi:hypothetical protein